MSRRLSTLTALSAVIAGAVAATAFAQAPGTAQVSGAEVVNVRQGPGLDHPVIGVLHRGQVLEVVGGGDGQWVHVRSADIDGHVNIHFLELAPPPQPTAVATHTRGAAARTPQPTPTLAAAGAAVPESAAPAQVAAETALDGADLRRDIEQILSMTEAVHRDVKMLQTLQVADPPGNGISGLRGGFGLLLLGAVIGFVVGNIFGRQQERGSRSRVRF